MNEFQRKVFAFVFDHLIAQKFLEGKRMYLAGFSSILVGVTLTLDMLAGGHYSNEKAASAFAAIAFGYKTIGEAGKHDRLIEAAAKGGAKE